ncbi:MAG: heme ABC exporter ATP-binding protein CcmA [Rubricella sp.]
MTLALSDLSIRRSGRPILTGLSMEAAPGEAVILRGPNGAGKSTLLRAIAGLVPFDGRIAWNGSADRDALHAALAFAGHLDAIKPQLTVEENIRFWAGLFGGDAEAAMARFRLGEIADRPTFACSAGQKRRTGLARLALAANRPLWLLDEPTVSLDTDTVALFAGVVSEHLARGGIVLVATHIDLGLGDARTVTLSGPGAAERESTEDDPFLSEGWG